jgi:hypothetical protein
MDLVIKTYMPVQNRKINSGDIKYHARLTCAGLVSAGSRRRGRFGSCRQKGRSEAATGAHKLRWRCTL